MILRVLAVFSLFLCAVPHHKALAETAAAVPSWTIQKESSKIEFEGLQEGAPFTGFFRTFEGKIDFDPANLPASKAAITIPIDGIDANSTDRNKYLPQPDWFNLAEFPVARFVTTSIKKGLTKDQYVADGILTIRDISLPVTLLFTLNIKTTDSGQVVAVMAGETMINRLDFGVGQGEWKDTRTIENQVKIRISLTAIRK